MPADRARQQPRATVFGPAPTLTVTVEAGTDTRPEVHVHAGGQGFWIAHLMARLGLDVTLVGPFGGEIGQVLRTLVPQAGLAIEGVPVGGTNGAYVHDRRSGEREEIAEMAPTPLSRHEADELFGAALVSGLDADVVVLAGPGLHPIVPAELYGRLTSTLRARGALVVADLSGAPLEQVVGGGVSVLKVADDELRADGWLDGSDRAATESTVRRLLAAGAGAVVVTLAESGAIVADGLETHEIEPPVLAPVDPRGAGDSLTAGTAAALARGSALVDAVRYGSAAGALNATRHGLGTGQRSHIERLARHVVARRVDERAPCEP